MRFIIKKLHSGSVKGYYWKIEIELPDIEAVYDFLEKSGHKPNELEIKEIVPKQESHS